MDASAFIRERLLSIFSEDHLRFLRDHRALNVGLVGLDHSVAHLALVLTWILGPSNFSGRLDLIRLMVIMGSMVQLMEHRHLIILKVLSLNIRAFAIEIDMPRGHSLGVPADSSFILITHGLFRV